MKNKKIPSRSNLRYKKVMALTRYKSFKSAAEKKKAIEEYIPLVELIVGKYYSSWLGRYEWDELVSHGVLSLVKAANNFKKNSKGHDFKIYASVNIRYGILDELRKGDLVPRGSRERIQKIRSTYYKLHASLGREPSDDEMRREMKMTWDEYHEFQKNSFEAKEFAIEEVSFGKFEKDEKDPFLPFENKDYIEKILEKAKRILTKKQYRVVKEMYKGKPAKLIALSMNRCLNNVHQHNMAAAKRFKEVSFAEFEL